MKDPHTRLLDLLAGWESFLSKEENALPHIAEPEVTQLVADLYQEVGRNPDMNEFGLRYALARMLIIVVNGAKA